MRDPGMGVILPIKALRLLVSVRAWAQAALTRVNDDPVSGSPATEIFGETPVESQKLRVGALPTAAEAEVAGSSEERSWSAVAADLPREDGAFLADWATPRQALRRWPLIPQLSQTASR